jgi:hypothetical protein
MLGRLKLTLTPEHLSQLIAIESGVHYGEPPPPGRKPYLIIRRSAPVLLSAPHGARTFRNSVNQIWHEEDEYTAGIALLLSELCNASVIATLWRTDDSDPNHTKEDGSEYKREIRRLAQEGTFHWLIDLHGLGDNTDKLLPYQLVDLGTRKERQSFPQEQLDGLVQRLESRLGEGTVSQNAFPAYIPGRTVVAFCHQELGIPAVQIEMKPRVRVPFRRSDSSSYASTGPYAVPAEGILGMLQALADFIIWLG